VTLLDRSERRADLVRRAVRVIGIGNANLLVGDVEKTTKRWPAATFRAVAAPVRALRMADRVVDPDGRAVIGLRGAGRSLPPIPSQRSASIVDVPEAVLDGSVSLLIMGSRGY
jgi:16S rRNA G527 N7-methylase RsmG